MVSGIESDGQAVDNAHITYRPTDVPNDVKLVVALVVLCVTIPAAAKPAGNLHVVALLSALGTTFNVNACPALKQVPAGVCVIATEGDL